MRIERLGLRGFRNFAGEEICFHPAVNLFCGENAQGKTNLLEAVWLFTGAKSFRGAKDREMIRLGEGSARLELEFCDRSRSQQAQLTLAEKKSASLNGIPLPSARRLAGQFLAVVFSPVHLSLIKDGPAGRRRFLDSALCQLSPAYLGLLLRYQKALAQRGSLLRDLWRHGELYDTLEVWEEELSRTGGELIARRAAFVRELAKAAGEIHRGISRERERLELEYVSFDPRLPALDAQEIAGALRQELCRRRAEDIRTGATSAGPHRDDLEIKIGGLGARSYASQGQQRSGVLALKLGECEVIRRRTGEEPVVLLDDVMSELDESRREYLIHHLEGRQVLITCCEGELAAPGGDTALFLVKEGTVTPCRAPQRQGGES